MSQPKVSEPELALPEIDLVENDHHDKVIKLTKDVAGLKRESNLIFGNHFPEIMGKLEHLSDEIHIVRDDLSDTNALCRKVYYEEIPAIHSKLDGIISKLEALLKK